MTMYPERDFARATPESQGVASSALLAAVGDIYATGKDIHSMLILRGGRLIFEKYFAPYSPETKHSMFSCSKTFTSMLIGIARGKGLLRLTDSVISFFPEVEVAEPSENLRRMTIADLLMMGSGNAKDTFDFMCNGGDDYAATFLNRPVEYAPGTHFTYNTGATYMLSAILTRLTGKTALELANEWLFGAIGVREAEWAACPKGISLGGTGLRITPRDMARFGLLLLNEGCWKGEQLVPREYVLKAREKHIDNCTGDPNQNPNWAAGYCFQMWRCAFDAFRADGYGGQYIVMIPGKDMVCVFTSALGSDIGYPLELIEKFILPGVGDDALPETAPEDMPSEAAGLPWGRVLRFEDNSLKISRARFLPREARIEMHGDEADITLEFACGWGAPELSPGSEELFGGARLAASYSFDGALRLRLSFVGEPMTMVLNFAFSDDGAEIAVATTLAGSATLKGKFE